MTRKRAGNSDTSDKEKKSLQPDYRLRFFVLIIFFIIVFFGSFWIGRYGTNPWQLIKLILSEWMDMDFDVPQATRTVILNIRLPRAIAAVLIGAALSAAGAAYQGMFRNPMVSPDVLGASAGAAFGAALSIFLGVGYFLISISSFAFGLSAVLLAYFISRRSRTNVTLGMVLAGMVIASLFSSATSFIKLIADTDSVLPAITYWLMGSLSSIRWKDVLFAGIPILIGIMPLFLLRWRINILTLGEDEARSMGIDTVRMRIFVITCATLITAASVSVSGLIGWVGLVIPHFSRLIFGNDYSRIMPASIMFGGSYMLLVDDISRIIASTEIPLGILTSVIGAPVFVWLIVTGGHRNEA